MVKTTLGTPLKKVKVKFAQSCLTLCDPVDYTVHGILQARILEWVAFLFSRGSSNPRIEPRSPTLQADSLPAEPQGKEAPLSTQDHTNLNHPHPTQPPSRQNLQ